MNIIFHIGYPKTASRWFQESLFINIKNARIVDKSIIFKSIIKPEGLTFTPETIFDPCDDNLLDHLIFSSHELIGTNYHFGFHGYYMKENAQRIHKIFPDAKIILFIRNQPDIIASAYMQYIEEGGTYSVSKYLDHKRFKHINRFPLFSFSFYEYHHIIEYYQNLFGKSNVYTFLFEDFQKQPEEFVLDFCQTFKFKIESNQIAYAKVNTSYRIITLILARFFNHFTEMKMLNKHYLFHIPYLYNFTKSTFQYLNRFRIFGKISSSRNLLGKRIISFVSDYYKHSNQILRDKHKLPVDQYGYPL